MWSQNPSTTEGGAHLSPEFPDFLSTLPPSMSTTLIVSFKKVLLERRSIKEGRDRFPICLFPTQVATMARAGPGRNHQPGTASESAAWVAGAQACEPSSAPLPGMLAGSCMGRAAARIRTGALVGDAATASSGWTCCVTVLAMATFNSVQYPEMCVFLLVSSN